LVKNLQKNQSALMQSSLERYRINTAADDGFNRHQREHEVADPALHQRQAQRVRRHLDGDGRRRLGDIHDVLGRMRELE
jgi:hypothetical protein